VWFMTQGTIFGYRCVLPCEWPALFRMAGVTGLVKGRFNHEIISNRPVGIMALRAAHLAKAHRMNGGHKELLALLLVALETDFRLACIR